LSQSQTLTIDGKEYEQEDLNVFIGIGTAVCDGGMMSAIYQGAYPDSETAGADFLTELIDSAPPGQYHAHDVMVSVLDSTVAASGGYEKTNAATYDPALLGGVEYEAPPTPITIIGG
jgi:hypothetical protein